MEAPLPLKSELSLHLISALKRNLQLQLQPKEATIHTDLLTSNYAFTVHIKISEWLVEQRSSPDGANFTWFTTPQCPRKS